MALKVRVKRSKEWEETQSLKIGIGDNLYTITFDNEDFLIINKSGLNDDRIIVTPAFGVNEVKIK